MSGIEGHKNTPWGAGPKPAELVGQVLDGRYRIVSRLDAGGMGEVYVAEQTQIDRKVAVKVMHSDAARSQDMARRFAAEAKIISGLRHPNTLKLFDYGETAEGLLYIVTELLSGATLKEALQREHALTAARTLKILRDVALSLDEAHGRGVIHRDLKPANIFLERVGAQEVVKVLDFGIAKVRHDVTLAHPEAPATMTGVIVGTPAYMSPEQARGLAVGPSADLYSLGVVGYHCLAGRLPFEGDSTSQLIQHARDLPPPLASLARERIDPRVEQLVMGLLLKEPEKRPYSASALASEIDRLLIDLDARPRPSALDSSRTAVSPATAQTVLSAELADTLQRPPPPVPAQPTAAAPRQRRVHLGLLGATLTLLAAGVFAASALSDRARAPAPASSSAVVEGAPPKSVPPAADEAAVGSKAADERAVGASPAPAEPTPIEAEAPAAPAARAKEPSAPPKRASDDAKRNPPAPKPPKTSPAPPTERARPEPAPATVRSEPPPPVALASASAAEPAADAKAQLVSLTGWPDSAGATVLAALQPKLSACYRQTGAAQREIEVELTVGDGELGVDLKPSSPPLLKCIEVALAQQSWPAGPAVVVLKLRRM